MEGWVGIRMDFIYKNRNGSEWRQSREEGMGRRHPPPPPALITNSTYHIQAKTCQLTCRLPNMYILWYWWNSIVEKQCHWSKSILFNFLLFFTFLFFFLMFWQLIPKVKLFYVLFLQTLYNFTMYMAFDTCELLRKRNKKFTSTNFTSDFYKLKKKRILTLNHDEKFVVFHL